MRITAILLAVCVMGLPAWALSFDIVTLVSVTGGDTIKVTIPGIPSVFGRNISVRIRGIDSPQLQGRCASEMNAAFVAKEYLTDFLQGARRLELRNVERGEGFQLLADVFADRRGVAETLLKAGFAVPYDGLGTRRDWCAAESSAANRKRLVGGGILAAIAVFGAGAVAFVYTRWQKSRRTRMVAQIQGSYKTSLAAILDREESRIPPIDLSRADIVPLAGLFGQIASQIVEAKRRGKSEIQVPLKNAKLAEQAAELFNAAGNVAASVERNGGITLTLDWG